MIPISVQIPEDGEIDCSPTYLFDYSYLYKTDPHRAGTTWFRNATFGLGIHYGLYSLIGKGEKALFHGHLTLDEYRMLPGKLKAEHFDAVDMVELAIGSGMRYITFNVHGADGFSMFGTKHSDFNCLNTPAHRDFLAELASVCEYNGIGLCLQYTLGQDWSRPEDKLWNKDPEAVDLGRLAFYQDFVHNQINELLTQYGPIAGICFDGIDMIHDAGVPLIEFGCQDLYNHVYHLQPQALVSFNHGLLGSEDFFSYDNALSNEKGFMAKQPDKPVEIRKSFSGESWGYDASKAGGHLRKEDVLDTLARARKNQSNFMISTALLPDGSLDFEDMQTLLDVGGYIEEKGYPEL